MTINTKEPVRFVSDTSTLSARIICDDVLDVHPIRALVKIGDGEETCWAFRADGTNIFGRLENIPEERTVTFWVNVFEDGGLSSAFSTRKKADACEYYGRIACAKGTLTYTKGEGL